MLRPGCVSHPVLGDFSAATVDFASCGGAIALIKFRICRTVFGRAPVSLRPDSWRPLHAPKLTTILNVAIKDKEDAL